MLRYCGRRFTDKDLEAIRSLIAAEPPRSRYKISLEVCEALRWRRRDGKPKDMSCRVALLRMQRDGLITLPPPKMERIKFSERPDIDALVAPPATIPEVDNSQLVIDFVANSRESSLWNAYIKHYHYLGFQLLAGAQLRYWVRCRGEIIALLSFGASAWKTKPRDEYIGWSAKQRERKLHLVVNNARFLILPWIHHRNLASKILSMIAHRLREDWHRRYAYRPVLLETFVDDARYRGTCYKAANWLRLGTTQGRGKLDSKNLNALPVKSIWTYPLVPDFRRYLCR
jgi:hypothetical protein